MPCCRTRRIKQKLRAAFRPPSLYLRVRFYGSGLDSLYVLGLPAFGAFDHIELYLLTFLQAPESVCLNRGEVYKYILPILAADKTIAFGVVKPLHCSCFHTCSFVPFSRDCVETRWSSAGRSRWVERRYCMLQKPERSNASLFYFKPPKNARYFVPDLIEPKNRHLKALLSVLRALSGKKVYPVSSVPSVVENRRQNWKLSQFPGMMEKCLIAGSPPSWLYSVQP
jgi:hypothetical protein